MLRQTFFNFFLLASQKPPSNSQIPINACRFLKIELAQIALDFTHAKRPAN